MDSFFDLTIRPDTPDDATAVERLAQIDSSDRPPGRLLVGEVEGELVAAISLRTGAFIADPFKPTSEAVHMLSMRREQLASVARRRPLVARLVPQL
jgi:hypothetical protein